MNVGVVVLQEPRISVTFSTSKTYLLSATQTPTQRSDRSYVRNAPPAMNPLETKSSPHLRWFIVIW